MFNEKFHGSGGGRGGNFHGGKLTPENAFQENFPREICPPSPKEKKKKKEN